MSKITNKSLLKLKTQHNKASTWHTPHSRKSALACSHSPQYPGDFSLITKKQAALSATE